MACSSGQSNAETLEGFHEVNLASPTTPDLQVGSGYHATRPGVSGNQSHALCRGVIRRSGATPTHLDASCPSRRLQLRSRIRGRGARRRSRCSPNVASCC